MTTQRITQLRAGVAGLALLRLYPHGSPGRVAEILEGLRSGLAEGSGSVEDPLDDPLEEREFGPGYDEWSANYDRANPVFSLEDPVLEPLLEALPVGVAADVACGTGRVALKLAALGHTVVAVDSNRAMLAVLEARATGIEARVGALEELPLDDSSIDILTCALALTHVIALEPVVREFARVLRPGGTALLSDIHPLVCATGGQAYYRTVAGERRFVRNFVHLLSEYLAAFQEAGLDVVGCWEPPFGTAVGLHLLSPGVELDRAVAQTAFERLPGLLIWRLRKGG